MKVLFLVNNLYIGGIPKALLSLLNVLDKNIYKIDVFCPAQIDGAYIKEFSQYNLLKQDLILSAYTRYKQNLELSLYSIFIIALKFFRHLLIGIGIDLYKLRLTKIAKQFSNKYDVVVAYSEGDMTEMGANIDAPLKVAWIHMDYKRIQEYTKSINEFDFYFTYDKIIIPSQFSAKSFCEVYPNLSNRVQVFPNVLNVADILQKSQCSENIDARFDNRNFTIVSVGRICEEKQFYRIPHIVSKIKSDQFVWYILGPGSRLEVSTLMKNIDDYNVSNRVKYLGPKENPYPYILRANLLVSLSISETFSYVINEAKLIGTPVISAPFGSSNEVMSPHDLIVDVEKMPNEILKMVEDSTYYESYKRKTHKNEKKNVEDINSIFVKN